MLRILVQWGPFTVFSYGVMLVAAFLVVAWLMERDAKRLPPLRAVLKPPQVIDWACLVMLSGVVGARLLFIAKYWEVFRVHPWEMLAIWHGGLIWYGGFFGGLLTVVVYARVIGVSFLRMMDQCIPYIPLAHAIGRLGCFLNGCCYGKITHAWYGVTFPGHPGPRIPTQIIEAMLLCALFMALRRLQRTSVMNRRGRIFALYLVGYGLLRFAVEFLRGDQTVLWFGLTVQQDVSLVLVAGGCLLWMGARRSALPTGAST